MAKMAAKPSPAPLQKHSPLGRIIVMPMTPWNCYQRGHIVLPRDTLCENDLNKMLAGWYNSE